LVIDHPGGIYPGFFILTEAGAVGATFKGVISFLSSVFIVAAIGAVAA
jgi:hypothetical protein